MSYDDHKADDLTMPDDVAKRTAAELRTIATAMRLAEPLSTALALHAARLTALADTFDPPPLSLREQVEKFLRVEGLDNDYRAIVLLNLVADALAAQPLDITPSAVARSQRDADVAFIRPGGAT